MAWLYLVFGHLRNRLPSALTRLDGGRCAPQLDRLRHRGHERQRCAAFVGTSFHPEGHGLRRVDRIGAVGAFVVGIMAFAGIVG